MNYKLPFIGKLAFALISITILVYWLMVLQDILVPIFISIILSMSIFPVANWLENKGLGRIWAVTLTLLLFTVVAFGIIWLASTQISDFGEMLPQLEKKLTNWFNQIQRWAESTFHVGKKTQIARLRQYGTGFLSTGGSFFTSALSTTGSVLGNLSLIPIYMFFFLYYRDFFKMFFYKVFNNVSRKKIDSVLTKIYEVVHSYLTGLVTVTLIVGSLNTIGLLALGIDYAVFFGFLAAALLVIPFIGILIGSILPIILALITKDSPMYAVGVAGVFIFVQFLEGNFITPQIVGSKISINGLIAIIALLLGSALWGVAGMALSLPTIAILKVVFDAVPDLKPFGYILGEPDHEKLQHEKRKSMGSFMPDFVESIVETTEDVRSLVSGKKRKGKSEKID
ncbi:AI-2E family transporter [Arcicella sp. LKC2W]|uniref:AI-2E family transporter n=1 Tax=Arcicella sp. LKC2W TaxID=2984198 RepID=UPI002B20943D|nr:AI-2E family transporter [Arcicella sp. LKC2W]MEA5459036.1 AI-2E family transporter [Arcicella sp. LKC2W]